MQRTVNSTAWTSLCDVLERQARDLQDLVKSMIGERAAYIAQRPSTLTSTMGDLQTRAEATQAMDVERTRLVHELANLVGRGSRKNVRLRDLTPFAPSTVKARLDRAGQAVDRAARAVQIESRVGARLLESSRQVQLGLVDALAGVTAQENAVGASAYGPDARYGNAAGAPTHGGGTGRLVSGIV